MDTETCENTASFIQRLKAHSRKIMKDRVLYQEESQPESAHAAITVSYIAPDEMRRLQSSFNPAYNL